MTCFVMLTAIIIGGIIEDLPIDWGFIPHLINDILILWGVD